MVLSVELVLWGVLENNPHSGVPYGVIDLTAAEYASVQPWLQNEAPVDWLPWTANASEQ